MKTKGQNDEHCRDDIFDDIPLETEDTRDDKTFAGIPIASSFPNEWYDPSEDAYWESYI